MGVNRAIFESAGQRTEHLIPGAYSRVNYERQAGGGVAANNAVILGDAKGGEPKKVLYFRSPSEARAVLRGGALLEGVLHAFDPGNGYVPQRVGAMRVNVGARATSAMKYNTTTQIELVAWDWGLHTNQLKRKFEAGTDAGTHKVTVQLGNGAAEVFDNISHPSFSLQYIGTGSAATAAIGSGKLTTTVTGAEADNLDIDFASFPTVEDVVNYINDNAKYQAVLLTGNGAELTADLDNATGVAIKASAGTFKSDLKAIIDAFARSTYIGSATHPAAEATRNVPAYDSGWVYFTGGSNGTADATAYTNALTALEQEDVQILSTISTDEAVHLLIADHCKRMSSTEGRKERMAWVGGASGETVAATVTRAKNIASDLVNLAYPGFSAYDPINPALGIKDCSAAMYACKMLGMETAVAVNEPVTNKQVQVLGWQKALTKSEIETLISAGVTVGAKSDDGLLVTIRAVTTWQGDELQRCERSMVRESQYMARDFRAALRGDVGRPANLIGPSTIASVLGAKAVEWYNLGLILKGDKPLVWGTVINEVGDALYVEYHTYLTAPRNFLFATANLHVLTQQVVAI